MPLCHFLFFAFLQFFFFFFLLFPWWGRYFKGNYLLIWGKFLRLLKSIPSFGSSSSFKEANRKSHKLFPFVKMVENMAWRSTHTPSEKTTVKNIFKTGTALQINCKYPKNWNELTCAELLNRIEQSRTEQTFDQTTRMWLRERIYRPCINRENDEQRPDHTDLGLLRLLRHQSKHQNKFQGR